MTLSHVTPCSEDLFQAVTPHLSELPPGLWNSTSSFLHCPLGPLLGWLTPIPFPLPLDFPSGSSPHFDSPWVKHLLPLALEYVLVVHLSPASVSPAWTALWSVRTVSPRAQHWVPIETSEETHPNSNSEQSFPRALVPPVSLSGVIGFIILSGASAWKRDACTFFVFPPDLL